MNQPYFGSGDEPYPSGGGPAYPAGGQPPYPPGSQPPWEQPAYPPGGQAPYPPGGQPGYLPPYPTGGGPQYPAGPAPYQPGWQPPTPSGPPPSIQRAVMLMYVGAGLEALGLIFDLITHKGSTAADIPGALIGIGLWVWMAQANRAGKGWARITSTVFFGIDCLVLLLLLAGVGLVLHSASSSAKPILVLAVVAGVVTWGIGLATIVLLWKRESSEYYAAMKAR